MNSKKENSGFTIWTASFLALLAYTVAILYQYSYNNYFNIPRTFIQSSLVANVTFFYEFAKGFIYFIEGTNIITIVALIFIVLLYIWSLTRGKVISTLMTISLFIFFAYFASWLGSFVAEHTDVNGLRKFDSACSDIPKEEGIRYVVPITYESKAVVVGLNINGKPVNKMWVMDLANTKCPLE